MVTSKLWSTPRHYFAVQISLGHKAAAGLAIREACVILAQPEQGDLQIYNGRTGGETGNAGTAEESERD